MSAERSPVPPAHRRAVIALVLVALLLVVGCAVFLFAGAHGHRDVHARARVRDTNPGGLAAEIQANIAEAQLQAAERRYQVDRHENPRPDDEPPARQVPSIKAVDRVARHFLAGYLPYEVGQLSRATRTDITATSTASLAHALLSHIPIIPPPQQQLRPPQGRLVGLRTTLATDNRTAQIYVEVAYGLSNEGFTLVFTKQGKDRWQAAAFHG
jgi:hypothetical protein